MRKRRSNPINSINVVPYLDVLLVLLVIFMITAPLFNQGAVDLPSIGESDAPPPKAGAVIVSYHADATFGISHQQSDEAGKDLGEEELLARLESIWLLYPDAPVVVESDKDASLGDVMKLVGKIRKLGGDAKAPGGSQIALSVKTGDDES